MALYLIEFSAVDGTAPALFGDVRERLTAAGVDVIEQQYAKDLGRAYIIAATEDERAVEHALAGDLPTHVVAPVRLVGATLEEARAAGADANYLVEWDLPEGLSMDRYLTRKREKAPLYAKVPEVRFRRTYVREDMEKCLCLYDSPDDECVRRAREAVDTPIDRLTRIERPA